MMRRQTVLVLLLVSFGAFIATRVLAPALPAPPIDTTEAAIDPILDALDELRADIKDACKQVRKL